VVKATEQPGASIWGYILVVCDIMASFVPVSLAYRTVYTAWVSLGIAVSVNRCRGLGSLFLHHANDNSGR
jgi:hypothetical protein